MPGLLWVLNLQPLYGRRDACLLAQTYAHIRGMHSPRRDTYALKRYNAGGFGEMPSKEADAHMLSTLMQVQDFLRTHRCVPLPLPAHPLPNPRALPKPASSLISGQEATSLIIHSCFRLLLQWVCIELF